ncbi:MAG TPA: hypothetical protein VE046_13035 [Steroidobacteraceae bacterium]|nr:hypothetical protein [Steroidobacteraceae bacterium]
MGRRILSVVAGLAAWFVVATILDFVLRLALPGYHEAEPTMAFTLTMQIARLAEGAIATLAAGLTTALVAQGNRTIVMVLGALLVLLFIPVHYQLRDAFPLWYHLTFLLSLFPLALIGALLVRKSPVPAP